MSKSYKSVSELTKGWNEDDFFDIAHLQMIESYEGIDEEPFFDTIVEMVIKIALRQPRYKQRFHQLQKKLRWHMSLALLQL